MSSGQTPFERDEGPGVNTALDGDYAYIYIRPDSVVGDWLFDRGDTTVTSSINSGSGSGESTCEGCFVLRGRSNRLHAVYLLS